MKILLTPNYNLAKNIIADATVEAEYGDNLVEGTTSTLAHHGSRSHNPAPCNTPDVPVLNDNALLVMTTDNFEWEVQNRAQEQDIDNDLEEQNIEDDFGDR